MKPKQLIIALCHLVEIRQFIEKNHYSHSINGVKVSFCFKVICDDILVGGVIFGQLSTTAWKRFSDSETKVIELRRLYLIDEAERNCESHVIGWCLRWLKRNVPAVDVVVSYADPQYGHSGIIYKAANFIYYGLTSPDKGYKDKGTGKIYHSRALRTTYRGEFKPFAKTLRSKLLNNDLEVIELPGKHCYVYRLRYAPKKKAE